MMGTFVGVGSGDIVVGVVDDGDVGVGRSDGVVVEVDVGEGIGVCVGTGV